ncbi:glycosyltransferase [Billgrantia sp. C5P2]|uniref:glycosyltransferase n=1 Tax=Billgrantia sp. C5P2 TaxID=3436239 RepID=UPI003DA4CC94
MSADNQIALTAFQKARAHFTQRCFSQARLALADYRHLIRYEAFQHEDRRLLGGLPSCSVIIVSYAAGPGLLECLDTLLAQTHPAFEVILIDNGGNESLQSALKHRPILHVQCPMNLLPSEARNIGAYFSRGSVLVFVDDDGQVCEDYLHQAEQALHKPNVIGVRGRILPLTASGASIPHYDQGEETVPSAFTLEGNMAIRRSVFRAAGGFDPLMFGHEGKELTERCQRLDPAFQVLYWPKLLLYHDYAQGARLQAKRERQQLGADYRVYLEKLRSKTFKCFISEPRIGDDNVSQAGISVLLRAGNDAQAARKFLEQFIKINTYKPVEVFVLFNEPRTSHLNLVREFAGRLSVIVLSVEKRTFSSLLPKLRYDYALIVSTPTEIGMDVLGQAIVALAGAASGLYMSFNKQVLGNSLLLGKQELLRIESKYLQASKDDIEEGLGNKKRLFFPPELEKNTKSQELNGSNSMELKSGKVSSPEKLLNDDENYSNKIIHECNYFVEKDIKPHTAKRALGLNVAFFGSNQLCDRIQKVCDIIDLSKRINSGFPTEDIDFLLVESTLESSLNRNQEESLKELFLQFKERKVPTVFWYTEAYEHCSFFLDIVDLFDFIYVAEEQAVQWFKSQTSKHIAYAPLGIVPEINNPVKTKIATTFTNLYVMYDGWADLIEYKENRDLLTSLNRDDLLVFDSNWKFKKNKLLDFPDYKENIIGCITYKQRLQALKEFNVLLITSKTLKSSAKLRKEIVEALAAKSLVICYGEMDLGDIGKWVEFYNDFESLNKRLDYLKNNPLELKSKAQNAWRKVHSEYTVSQRLKQMAVDVGVEVKDKNIRISCITITKRPHHLDNIIKNYLAQSYVEKELIVIINSFVEDFSGIVKYIKDSVPNAQVYQIGCERNIGFCLNFAINRSSGDYWAKMDDDDQYGKNYIFDYHLSSRYLPCDLIGKKMGYTYFEAYNAVFLRNPLAIDKSDILCSREHSVHMSGATFFGRKELIESVPFAENVRSSVDSDFYIGCLEKEHTVLITDDFNFVVFRANNKDHHTWKQNDADLIKRSIKICDGFDCDFFES